MPLQLNPGQKVLLQALEREWYENDGCGMDAEELEEATSFDASAIPEILAPLVSAGLVEEDTLGMLCLLYTSPSPRDTERSRMPSSA